MTTPRKPKKTKPEKLLPEGLARALVDRPSADETLQRLATFARSDTTEMRVDLATCQGNPFISLRLWERNQAGRWWPVQGKGCSIRMAEVAELAEVLALVASGGQGAAPPRDDAPKFVDKGRPVRRSFDPSTMPKLEGGEEGFDEFGG